MALSIKNHGTEQLAREFARRRGVGLTEAITEALQGALLREQGRRSVLSLRDEIAEIADRCRALSDLDARTPDQILGYDDDGGFA